MARARRERLPENEKLQMLTEIRLDKLSFWDRILRRHGFIVDGYVLEK